MFDIHFQLIAPELQKNHKTGKFFTFGFRKPVGIQGPQKLFNRWVKLFFTSQGSNPLNLDQGVNFTSLIGSNINEVSDLESLMNIYIERCNDQLVALDNKDIFNQLTADEKLADATMTNFTFIPPDGFDATIDIRSISGKRLTVLLPISILTGS